MRQRHICQQIINLSFLILFCYFFFHFLLHRTYFGESHQKYADTLLDYGFFLLNVDDIVRSVHAYTVISIYINLQTRVYQISTTLFFFILNANEPFFFFIFLFDSKIACIGYKTFDTWE